MPEFSRRARGFTVYAALRTLGRSGVRDLVERCCAIARRMAEQLSAADGVEILNDVVLNQVLVRFLPPDGGDADDFTREVIRRVQADGTLWLSGTTWHEMAAMRISVSNWSTTEADADRSVAAILAAAQASWPTTRLRGERHWTSSLDSFTTTITRANHSRRQAEGAVRQE